jgi:hypothetical protein
MFLFCAAIALLLTRSLGMTRQDVLQRTHAIHPGRDGWFLVWCFVTKRRQWVQIGRKGCRPSRRRVLYRDSRKGRYPVWGHERFYEQKFYYIF